MLRLRAFRSGTATDIGTGSPGPDPETVARLLEDPTVTAWVDMTGCGPDELLAMQRRLGFHDLAVEDVLGSRQRAKLESYGRHLFLNCYVVSLRAKGTTVGLTEVSAFITANVVVVVGESAAFDGAEVLRRAEEQTGMPKDGSGFLLHSLLDYIVDGQLSLSETLDQKGDELGDLLFDKRPNDLQQRSFGLHKELTRLRRVIVPMREVMAAILRHQESLDPDPQGSGGAGEIGPRTELEPYFRDVYDHVLRAIEWTDSARETVNSILQTHLTIQGNNMNVVMKKVTSWAAIIAVPTLVTGFYGMNVPYPGFGAAVGLWVSAGLMVALSTVLWWTFKRNDWL